MAEASVKNVEAVRKGLLAVVFQDRQQSLAYRDCQTGCFRVRAVLCGFAYLRSAAATRGRKGRTAFWGNRRSASNKTEERVLHAFWHLPSSRHTTVSGPSFGCEYC